MSLRVISGIAKGRRLKSVPGDTTRPVTDQVKEALFNILAGDVQDSRWWDMFAGTGAVGIEALSRGASFVRFTDSNRLPVDTIKVNLENTGFAAKAEVRRADAFSLLASDADQRFDFVYIAPPQYKALWSRALMQLDSRPDWLGADACVVVQIHPKEDQQLGLHRLREFDRRRYGSTLVIFYEQVVTEDSK